MVEGQGMDWLQYLYDEFVQQQYATEFSPFLDHSKIGRVKSRERVNSWKKVCGDPGPMSGASSRGTGEAHYFLAYCFEHGLASLPKNRTTAASLYTKGALYNYGPSAFRMAAVGGAETAIQWLTTSIECSAEENAFYHHVPFVQTAIGVFCALAGKFSKAEEYFAAAAITNSTANYLLGKLCKEREQDVEALAYFRRASCSKHAGALLELGEYHSRGIDGYLPGNNHLLAIVLWQQAVEILMEKNDAVSIRLKSGVFFALGNLYFHGCIHEGTNERSGKSTRSFIINRGEGLLYYKKAADAGSVRAMEILAEYYLKGVDAAESEKVLNKHGDDDAENEEGRPLGPDNDGAGEIDANEEEEELDDDGDDDDQNEDDDDHNNNGDDDDDVVDNDDNDDNDDGDEDDKDDEDEDEDDDNNNGVDIDDKTVGSDCVRNAVRETEDFIMGYKYCVNAAKNGSSSAFMLLAEMYLAKPRLVHSTNQITHAKNTPTFDTLRYVHLAHGLFRKAARMGNFWAKCAVALIDGRKSP